jgi:predicted P-loop ATPase
MNDGPTPRPNGGTAPDLANLAALNKKRRKPGASPRAQLTPAGGGLMTPNKAVCSNIGNALALLESEPALINMLAYDEMLAMPILMHPVPSPNGAPASLAGFAPRPWTDEDTFALQTWLQWCALRSLTCDMTWSAVRKRAHDCAFHPVRNYLNSLAWDEKERLPFWLPDYFEAPDDTYSRAIGPMFLIAMVARILRPGVKADYMLVLEGPQGVVKSQACSILGGAWFSSSLPDITHVKDAMHHLQGKWLIEVAELHAISRAETSLLKSFISREVDRYRPPYGRAEVIQPRQCVFIGTTNEKTYLRDHTGGRRFWPVACGIPDVKALARDRDQLFAEAVVRFRRGEHWWPERAFEDEFIKPEQEVRRDQDAWEPLISDWLDKTADTKIRVAQVAQGALYLEHNRLGRAEQLRIVAIMSRKGWERGVRTGEAQWWVRVKE